MKVGSIFVLESWTWDLMSDTPFNRTAKLAAGSMGIIIGFVDEGIMVSRALVLVGARVCAISLYDHEVVKS